MRVGDAHRVKRAACINCGTELDGATSVKEDGEFDNGPKDGDITVCIYCSHIMAFGKKGKFRELTDAEQLAIAGDPKVVAVVNAISLARKKRGNL